MKYVLALLLLMFVSENNFAREGNNIKGDWVAIRSEWNNRSIYFLDTAIKYLLVSNPNMQLNFEDNDTVCLYEGFVNDKARCRSSVVVKQDTLTFSLKKSFSSLFYDFKVEKQTKDTLILKVGPNNPDRVSRMYFIPKRNYESLSEKEIKTLAGPNQNDYKIYNSLSSLMEQRIFTMAEQMPQYPFFGKDQKDTLIAFIKKDLDDRHIDYSNGLTIKAVVEITGRLSHISIEGSSNPDLLKHITQLLNNSMRWLPAKQNGPFVRCYTVMHISAF